MLDFISRFRKALWLAYEHDVLNTAKALAYSGMLMLFPALVVVATLIALVPAGTTLTGELRSGFDQFLPADTIALIQTSLAAKRVHSAQLIFSATSLSIFAGVGLMLSVMDGFRRAYRLPRNDWGIWRRSLRAILLVPISLGPLALATLILVFGHPIEVWMIANAGHDFKVIVLVLWRLARWTLAFITCVSVLLVLYHFGTKRKENWLFVIPGAVAAALVWFAATLAFGWYVTRVADYSIYYGSFAAGIATLVWLYITAISVLLGAELNGVLFRERTRVARESTRPRRADPA